MTASEEFRKLVTEAYERSGKGVLAFERDHGLKPSSIKAIVNKGLRQTPSIDKAERIAAALGLEFYVGPRRDADSKVTKGVGHFSDITAPVYGWASCGPKGEGRTRADTDRHLPTPVGIDASTLFYAIAKGQSMRQEGIASGAYVLIDTSRTPMVGDRVWFRDSVGMTSLKRLTAIDGETVTLRGWMAAGSARVSSFNITVPPSGIDAIYPVIAVFDSPPTEGQEQEPLPDPRATEFLPRQTSVDTRIATALDLDQDADADTILRTISDLKQAKTNALSISDFRHEIETLTSTISTLTNRIERIDK